MIEKWVYNLEKDELWSHNNGELYDTREQCIEVAREDAKMEGKDIFYIGIATPYKRPVIDVERIIEDLAIQAAEELPLEIADEIYRVNEEDLDDLENRIEKVFSEWCKENNINPSDSYVITDIEECNCYEEV